VILLRKVAMLFFFHSLVVAVDRIGLPLYAQNRQRSDTQPKKAEDGTFTFRVPVDVVVVSARATDKEGKPVSDLRAEDFRVFEDGRPQTIHTFSVESDAGQTSASNAGDLAETQKLSPPLRADGETRFVSFVFDDAIVPAFADLVRAKETVRKFVEDGLAPEDAVAVMAASGRFQSSFSKDRVEILKQLETASGKFNSSQALNSECPKLSPVEALSFSRGLVDPVTKEVFIQHTIDCAGYDPSRPSDRLEAEKLLRSQAIHQNEEYQFRTRSLLHNLRQYLRSLKHLEGKKLVIVFSGGFAAGDVRYELQDIVTMALKGGITLNAVDARGLYTVTDPANEPGPKGSSGELQMAKTMGRISEMSMQKEPLAQLAGETGGLFVHNTNDLAAGLKQIFERNSFNYLLTYASPATKANGGYHSIKLEVLRPGVHLDYRKGYFSPKEQTTFVTMKRQDILEALSAPGDLNEIPIEVSHDCLRQDDGRFELGLVMRVGATRIPFLLEDGRQQNLLHFLLALFDENGRYVDGLEKAMELKLTDASYRSFTANGFSSRAQFRVPAGNYLVKAVVRESVHSKMGSLSKKVRIP
jgi:VWFA-related protein